MLAEKHAPPAPRTTAAVARPAALDALHLDQQARRRRNQRYGSLCMQYATCMRVCRLQQQAQTFAAAHPFTPSLVAKQPVQLVADVDSARRRRRQRLLQQRLQEQFRELQECTFQPRTRNKYPSCLEEDSVPHVAGLDRHLRLRALAAEQRRQRQEREVKVFVLHPKHPQTLTVPEPFKLGDQVLEAKAALRAQRVQHELLQVVSKECTFKPKLVARQQSATKVV